MKPTVGRSVYYYAHNNKIRPAIVSGVDTNDDVVDLHVFTSEGVTYLEGIPKTAEAQPFAGHWDWMPYQKGQAQKTEDAERVVRQEVKDIWESYVDLRKDLYELKYRVIHLEELSKKKRWFG